MDVASNLHNIEKRINEAAARAGRNPKEVKIIAVTKYVTAERAKEAYEAGIHHLGENRSEGILAKRDSFDEQPVWHFIGSLQEIQKRAEKPVDCLVQVNVSGEDTKHGITPQETIEFVKQLASFDKIRVIGLMTMAPLTDNKAEIRQCFRDLKELQVQIQNLLLPYAPCHELSMGMSNDFEIAVEEGSTMVRIGTALVGNE